MENFADNHGHKIDQIFPSKQVKRGVVLGKNMVHTYCPTSCQTT